MGAGGEIAAQCKVVGGFDDSAICTAWVLGKSQREVVEGCGGDAGREACGEGANGGAGTGFDTGGNEALIIENRFKA